MVFKVFCSSSVALCHLYHLEEVGGGGVLADHMVDTESENE